LLDDQSPAGIEVFQLTSEPDVPGAHLYMEAQVFLPDSRRFLLQRAAVSHGRFREDPEHAFLVCDLEDGGKLTPLLTEIGTTAPSISPDGKWVYYILDETRVNGGRLTLKRVRPDGTEREVFLVVDSPLPETGTLPSILYRLSTISSDSRRMALGCFLGDGRTVNADWGLLIFDLTRPGVRVLNLGRMGSNLHAQYCRDTDPEASHDLLIQDGHGSEFNEQGEMTERWGKEPGVDIHVIRDNGTNLRSMPWGRDASERCQGHQCWRGRTGWAITSTSTRLPDRPEEMVATLIESLPVATDGHLGLHTAGGHRNMLTDGFSDPQFWHFATDRSGDRLISDYHIKGGGESVYLADLRKPGEGPATFHYLVNTGTTGRKETHSHPFLSPDGRSGFFNSDCTGRCEAYIIRGLENVGT
jgi:hypothetical protein